MEKSKWVYAAIAILIIYLLPFLFLWENSPILIHDTLDSWAVGNKVLIESGQVLGPLDARVPQMMNGLPRNTFASELNFFLWMQMAFGFLPAYIISIALMHFIAFVGMYLLLRRYFLREKEHGLLVIGIALCFALLPFNSYRILGIAGQPLLLYALLNIKSRSAGKKEWLLVLIAPFFCNFTHVGIFFISGVFIFWLYDLARERKPNMPFFAAVIALTLISALVEYRLLYQMFFDSAFVSHRLEFIGYPTDLLRVLGRGARAFIFGAYHAASLHYVFVFAAAAAAIVLMYAKKAKDCLLLKLLAVIVAISVLTELVNGWDALLPLKEQFSLLKTFNFTRFNSFFPLLWYLVFALSLKIVWEKARYGKQIAFILILLQAGFLFSYYSPQVQAGGLGLVLSQEPSFKGFFAESLFDDIRDYIGKPQDSYRVVSIGLHPSAALYNGFYTLDGYHPNYPLEYKHEFREIIARELEKSHQDFEEGGLVDLKLYFDSTGGGIRAYFLVSELNGDYMCVKGSCSSIESLELNTEKVKEMGGKYIFSAVEIKNAEENGLLFLKAFEDQDSAWKIWLYEAP